MRFSFNWLKRYLSTNLSVENIADKLTAIGLEVDSVENPAAIFKNFKLAQIKNAEKHPGADNLKICVVEDFAGTVHNIVCGAKNARVGLKTILATPGAIIPSSGETLKKSKIRGIVSEGMMCSAEELAIPSKEDGIVEIDPNTDLSTPVEEVLDYDGGILDVSITPNRGDCLSVRGIARDLAAAGAGEFLARDEAICESSFKFPINIDYENSELCRRYVATIAFRVIRGVKNEDSPKWLKSALESAGLNSISMLVDLANWLMVDSGRPLHLYDLNKIKGDVRVRFAQSGEVFEDIKGDEHKLFSDMLVAADDESPLCLLGIMGGKKTACDENTTDILIESGLFNRICISKTGTLLNIASDSRARFERGIDKDSCVSGLEDITKLILENCGGEASDILIVGELPSDNREITLRKSKLDGISGSDIDWNAAKPILKKLGLKEIKSDESEAVFLPPSWRHDLNIEEDLIEEILRIIGYENVSSKRIDIVSTIKDQIIDRKKRIVDLKRTLAARGLSEVITYSFTKRDYAEAFKENENLIYLANPISSDLSVMRPSLIPTLLTNVAKSLNYGQANVAIFESGAVFRDSCAQELQISGVRLGNICDRNWLEKDRPVDIFDAKGDIFAILDRCQVELKSISTPNSAPSYYHPFRSGTIVLGKKHVGYFGELHPKIGRLFDIQERIICFEVFLDRLPLPNGKTAFCGGKIFPKINRDFAFTFPAKTPIGDIINEVRALDPLIREVSIFDCFNLNAFQKSIGICVTLDAVDRTLTEDEAQAVSNKIIKRVESVGGELRKK
jgi:phenylalanyl-tRNA synthetase beta chain